VSSEAQYSPPPHSDVERYLRSKLGGPSLITRRTYGKVMVVTGGVMAAQEQLAYRAERQHGHA